MSFVDQAETDRLPVTELDIPLTANDSIMMIDLPDAEFLVYDDQVVQLDPGGSKLLRSLIRAGGPINLGIFDKVGSGSQELANAFWLLEYDLKELTGLSEPVLTAHQEELTYRLNPELHIALVTEEALPGLIAEGILTDEHMVTIGGLVAATNTIRAAQQEAERQKLNKKLEKQKNKRRDNGERTHSGLRSMWNAPAKLEWEETSSFTPEELKLIGDNLPLVKFVVRNLAAYYPAYTDREELAQAGFFGLMECAKRYDPSYEASFSTYATPRIRGAILDHLRELDWAPRTVRHNARVVDRTRNELASELGNLPTAVELAEKLGIDETTLARMEADFHQARLTYLDEPILNTAGDNDITVIDSISDPEASKAFEVTEQGFAIELLAGLPDRKRRVMEEYYLNGLTLAQIGELMGVTESRICQIHGQALEALRRVLGEN